MRSRFAFLMVLCACGGSAPDGSSSGDRELVLSPQPPTQTSPLKPVLPTSGHAVGRQQAWLPALDVTANDKVGRLYNVELPSGKTTFLADAGVALEDIAWDPLTGKLYAVDKYATYSIDPASWKATQLATIPPTLDGGWLTGLALAADGTAFASLTEDLVATIDLHAGKVTRRISRNVPWWYEAGDIAFLGDRVFVTARQAEDQEAIYEVDLQTNLIVNQRTTTVRCIKGLVGAQTVLYGLSCQGDIVVINPTSLEVTKLTRATIAFQGATAR